MRKVLQGLHFYSTTISCEQVKNIEIGYIPNFYDFHLYIFIRVEFIEIGYTKCQKCTIWSHQMYPISKSYSNFQIQQWKSQFLGIFIATRLYKFYYVTRFVPNLSVVYFLIQYKWKVQKLGMLSLPEKSYLKLVKFHYEIHRNWVLYSTIEFL